MELKDFFAAVGGDSESVLSRFPSEAMVRRFLRKFPDDPSHEELKAALAAGDIPTAFRAAQRLRAGAAAACGSGGGGL